ncbi:hypothetical protein NC796_02785 [Aliifodinibius sp. S!AR15-10]|uniref:TlpA family protein disulfide reductase n=1 Tax=Aliifodinibius sp. S!AR15-10 TaxID=2950437 RepID=UPI00286404E7|nr:hypothetical protein [Aliifodinibius sp. S!AR15-10]MDR8390049.1 hypothetical protein [Aliifodinibius sp. S!AR15-10]
MLLSLDEQPANATVFMEDKEFPMPYYFPTNGLSASFRSPYIPSTFVVSKHGKIVYKKEGLLIIAQLLFATGLLSKLSQGSLEIIKSNSY